MNPPRTRVTGTRPDVSGRPIEEDVSQELTFHLDMRAQELIDAGWDPMSAREEARRVFGDMKSVNDECVEVTRSRDRAIKRAHRLDAFQRDLKYAARSLLRSPGFAAVAIVTLALGIGANSAIFSIVNTVLLRPLPYPDADRLVRVHELNRRGRPMNVPWANFVDWREQARAFDALGAFNTTVTTVLGGDRPARARVSGVSREFFQVFGLAPVVGRTTLPEEHVEGADPSVLVSHAFWEAELGGTQDLSGRTLRVAGLNARIVGVMPRGFGFPSGTDVWFPAEIFPQTPSRSAHNYRVVGRIREDVTPARARDDMNGVAVRLSQSYPGDADAVGATLETLQEELAGPVRRPLLLLLGAAGFVLLVACSNLASTLLARGTARQRELAIRASLGAARMRIIRQLFTESLLLSLLGALAGLVLAGIAIRTLVVLGPSAVPRLDELGLDRWVLLFTLVVSVMTAVLFGLFPALRLSEAQVGDALRSGSRGSSDEGSRSAWKLLVSAEVALALVLLIGSGLLIRSFWTVMAVDPGFDPRGVGTVALNLPGTEYPDDSNVVAYYDDLLARVARVPEVGTVGLTTVLPLTGVGANGMIEVEGRDELGMGFYRVVSGGYFKAMGIPLIRGRTFEDRDDVSVSDVILVNETLADRLWPGEDALGKRMSVPGMDAYSDPARGLSPEGWPYNRLATVIGVVADVKHASLTGDPLPEYYFHYKQRPARATSAVAVVKTAGDPAGLVPTLRSVVRQVDPQVPAAYGTMAQYVGRSVGDRRFTMALLSVFAAVALVLSAVGIYGVVSYSVARRTREIGIRMALGAEPGGVRWVVLRDAMGMVVVGLALGLAGAVAATRLLQNLLFEVSATDLPTFVGVAGLLAVVALMATWIPVRRTTGIDPMITMQAE